MHSRIIQVSSNVLGVDDYIGEYDYYDHWFTNAIADYVSDIDETRRKAELRAWLADISGLTYNEDAETITIVDKTKYFQYKYEEFMQHIMRLTSTDIDAFVKGSIDMDVWKIKSTYEDKFGIYIEDNGEYSGLIPLDRWIRQHPEGTTVYLGGMVDYHF